MNPDPPPAEKRAQMNVRVPVSLLAAIDARRGTKDMSRDKWVENALRFALASHPAAAPLSNTQGRTAPPPHRR